MGFKLHPVVGVPLGCLALLIVCIGGVLGGFFFHETAKIYGHNPEGSFVLFMFAFGFSVYFLAFVAKGDIDIDF